VSLISLLLVWTLAIICFAGFYMAADRQDPSTDCGLGPPGRPIQFYGAFAFSLETCTTVGYALPSTSNSFFNDCPGIQAVIYFQMVRTCVKLGTLLSIRTGVGLRNDESKVSRTTVCGVVVGSRPDE